MRTSDSADDELNPSIESPDSANGHASSDATESVCTESDVVRNLGMFCLKLNEQHGASDTVVNTVVTDVLNLMKCVHQHQQQQISTELHKTGFDFTSNPTVSSLLTQTSSSFDACEVTLGTATKRFRYYADNLPLVLPQQIDVGDDNDVVAFVSVTDVLEKWFSETDILSVISQFHTVNSNPAILTDFLTVNWLQSILLHLVVNCYRFCCTLMTSRGLIR